MINYEDLTEIEKQELDSIPKSRQDEIDSFFDIVAGNIEIEYKKSFDRNTEFNELLRRGIVSEKSDYYYKNGNWRMMK